MYTTKFSIPCVKVGNTRIPRALLGTSPFLAAGQFGAKSFKYYLEFIASRGNIKKIVSACLKMGIVGIQLISYEFIAREILEASRETDIKPIIVGTYVPDEPRSLDWLVKLESVIGLVHAIITDERNETKLSEAIDLIIDHGMLPGVVTHTPYKTLQWLMHSYFGKHKVKFIMTPLNYAGKFIDSSLPSIEDLYSELWKSNYYLIAKKVLGAGSLNIERAISYVYSKPYIVSAAFGIASIDEAKETFTLVTKYIGSE
ncbi:MAG: hypothetical protein DRO15_07780 [Thermoprotei archaeon]|nr:MAG: hypothetical protein DRO15_07780 [Thermoprotei archaeon]